MSSPESSLTTPVSGAASELLGALATEFAVESVDSVWVFPPRRIGAAESTVIVLALYCDDDDRRRIVTARFIGRRARNGGIVIERELAEHGIAPADRIERLIDGVLRRLGDDPAATPHAARIEGQPARWLELLAAHEPSPADPGA